jgi:signal transduction histidine kinase
MLFKRCRVLYVVSTNLCRFDSKPAVLSKIIFALITVFFSLPVISQSFPGLAIIKIDSVQEKQDVSSQAYVFVDSTNTFSRNITNADFTPLLDFAHRNKIPRRLLKKPFYLRISLQNNTGRQQEFYFFPGMLFDKITLFQVNKDQAEEIHPPRIGSGFVNIVIPPATTQTFIVALRFTVTSFGKITPILIAPSYLGSYKLELTNSYRDNRIASYILCGMLFMMILFVLVHYFLSFKIEFLYHCFFSICMFFLIFFSSYLSRRPGWFSAFFISYLDLILLMVGTIFYLAFIMKFLDTKYNHPVLDKLFRVEIWMLLALMIVYTFVRFQTDNIILGEIIENSMKILALLVGGVFIALGLRQKDKLINYLAIGSAAQIFFSIISLILIFGNNGSTNLLKSALFYFEIGIVMSVFFFLLGLAYKNRRDLIEKIKERETMKLEVEKKGFETQLAVIRAQQAERNRISEDMHDDLGAGMTSIRLFSELAKTRMGDQVLPEIEKISASANELLNKMNAIIWSMSSSNDSLGNMVAYIRTYALEYFDNTGINCKIEIDDQLPEFEVAGEIRRNIFLVIKEALNNIVKHSGADKVVIKLEQMKDGLSLQISDNGKGFDSEKIRQFGNGLKNMRKRMEDIGIQFHVSNHNGTTIRLVYQPVTPSA